MGGVRNGGWCGSFLGRALQPGRQSLFRAMFQLVVHADMIFPDEVVELRGLDVHHHGSALEVLDERTIVQVRQSLHEQLVEVFAGWLFAAFMQEEKILEFFRVGGLVREKLLHHHHGREDQNRHREERVTIPTKELHEFL